MMKKSANRLYSQSYQKCFKDWSKKNATKKFGERRRTRRWIKHYNAQLQGD
ncbi:hypothetical protein BN2497_1575 [Janthinobacterium sp. CG23_2]|nr:hypothetical protein BN2497_1575 [Janthinobacterium sp. CG23_2]CUU27185.1 hypothetical protein BN3177_1575 [Janthinobacterium sp. CG23_2]